MCECVKYSRLAHSGRYYALQIAATAESSQGPRITWCGELLLLSSPGWPLFQLGIRPWRLLIAFTWH